MMHPSSQRPRTTPTWFAGGLRFECRRCSACCRISGTVYVAQDELADLARARGLSEEQLCTQELYRFSDGYSVMEKASGECLYLGEDGACAVYAARPRQCRTFPFWRKLLRDPRQWKQYAANCPGMDHGELLTEEEILERMAQSPL